MLASVVADKDAAKHPPGHRAAPDLLQKRVFQPQRSIVLRLRSTDFEAVCDALPGSPSAGVFSPGAQGLSLVSSGLTPILSCRNKMQSLDILNFKTEERAGQGFRELAWTPDRADAQDRDWWVHGAGASLLRLLRG